MNINNPKEDLYPHKDKMTDGLVDSLARPGGNITGLATLGRDLSGKRLELLQEVVSRMSRVGVLWDANAPGPVIAFKEYEAAARSLKIPFQSLEARGPNPDLESAFKAAARGRVSAIITVRNPVFNRNSKRIVGLAIKNRLPSMYEVTTWRLGASCPIPPTLLIDSSAPPCTWIRSLKARTP